MSSETVFEVDATVLLLGLAVLWLANKARKHTKIRKLN